MDGSGDTRFGLRPPVGHVFDDITQTIGGTPLVRLARLAEQEGCRAQVLVKLEFFNPLASVKDRIALAMVRAAETDGRLRPGATLVEPTSGNTGIALAFVAAAKGYRLILTMPESMSVERRKMLKLLGCELELTPAERGMRGAIERAESLVATLPGAVMLQQFDNPANADVHALSTAEEIWIDTGGEVDAFVAGVGTGGTLSGTGRRLREEFPDMEIIAVEPERNAVLSTGESGDDDFQGMGPGFVSDNLDRDLIDRVETVRLENAEDECRRLAREEGVLVGQSSGATSLVSQRIASEMADPSLECPTVPSAFDDVDESAASETDGGQQADDCPLVVTVFWDSGERYLSTGLFD